MASQIINIENANSSFPSNKNFVYQSKNACFDISNFVARYANELTNDRGMLVSDIAEKLEEMKISMSPQMIGKVFPIFCDKTVTKIDSKCVTFYKLKPKIEVPEYVSPEETITKVESDESILKDNLHINTHIDKDSKSFDIYIMILLSYMKTDNFQTYVSTSKNMMRWSSDLYKQMTTHEYVYNQKTDKPSFAEKWLLNKRIAKLIPNSIPIKTTFEINELEFRACIQLVIINLDQKYQWSVDVKRRYDKYIEEQNKIADEKKKLEEQRRQEEEEKERERKRQLENDDESLEERRRTLIMETNQHNADQLHISYEEYVNFYNRFQSRFQISTYPHYDPIEYYNKLHRYDGKDLSTFKVKKSLTDRYYFVQDNYLVEFQWILDELNQFDPSSSMIPILSDEIKRRNEEIELKKEEIKKKDDKQREENRLRIVKAEQEYINFCKDKAENKPYLSIYGKEKFRKVHWDDERKILWYSNNNHDEDDDRHPKRVLPPYETNCKDLVDNEYVETVIRSYKQIQDKSHVWKTTLNYIEKQKKNKTNTDPRFIIGDLILQHVDEVLKNKTNGLKKLIKEEESDEETSE